MNDQEKPKRQVRHFAILKSECQYDLRRKVREFVKQLQLTDMPGDNWYLINEQTLLHAMQDAHAAGIKVGIYREYHRRNAEVLKGAAKRSAGEVPHEVTVQRRILLDEGIERNPT